MAKPHFLEKASSIDFFTRDFVFKNQARRSNRHNSALAVRKLSYLEDLGGDQQFNFDQSNPLRALVGGQSAVALNLSPLGLAADEMDLDDKPARRKSSDFNPYMVEDAKADLKTPGPGKTARAAGLLSKGIGTGLSLGAQQLSRGFTRIDGLLQAPSQPKTSDPRESNIWNEL